MESVRKNQELATGNAIGNFAVASRHGGNDSHGSIFETAQ
jgi:hypothetical protein